MSVGVFRPSCCENIVNDCCRATFQLSLETVFQILDGSKQTCSSAHQETADAARSEESANRDLRQDGPFLRSCASGLSWLQCL